MSESIFTNYWNEVDKLLEGTPNKSKAIYLSENPPTKFEGPTVVSHLYKSLACDGWTVSSGKNWEWRNEVPPYQTSSPEVALEREIMVEDISDRWTYQMSTTSGIQGPYLNKRRAIDLVTQTAPNCYTFIELKVDSDNPIYAAFEILGYALAYQYGRQHSWQGGGSHNVMDAQVINLIVLGPRRWYEYKYQGKNADIQVFNFTWLAQLLTDGLNHLTEGQPSMSFTFEEYVDYGDTKRTALAIINDATKW